MAGNVDIDLTAMLEKHVFDFSKLDSPIFKTGKKYQCHRPNTCMTKSKLLNAMDLVYKYQYAIPGQTS